MPATSKKKKDARKTTSRKAARARWRRILYRKTFTTEAWDWKENPRPYVRALCRHFGVPRSLKGLDPKVPEAFLRKIAKAHHLRLYDMVTLEGSDVYGFILSREALAKREIQQIEADYYGENFDEVYDPTISY